MANSHVRDALESAAAAVRANSALDADHACVLFMAGKAPPRLRVKGLVRLTDQKETIVLPEGLDAETLDLAGSRVQFATNIKARRLTLNNCKYFTELPAGLTVQFLELQDTAIRALPSDLNVEFKIDLANCKNLDALPSGLTTGVLVLRECVKIRELPEGLNVQFLDVSGCVQLRQFPQNGRVHLGRLIARGCANLERLPGWIEELAVLDLRNCAKLNELNEGLRVSAWLDVAGTEIKRLPLSLRGVGMRWRGVPVDERIVFKPETLTSAEVLTERNAEVRRVMLERLGFEKFLAMAEAKVLDTDFDLGGERRLLKVELPDDDDLVCVSFHCPSTSRQYVVRVPPKMQSCHAAVAWIAGFDNPDDYKPVIET
jgi:hypothetical protein